MDNFSQDEINELYKLYQSNDSHEIRQRGHALILLKKGFSTHQIASILNKKYDETRIIICAFLYFKFEFFFDDINELAIKVREVEYVEHKEIEKIEEKVNTWDFFSKYLNILLSYLIYLNPIYWLYLFCSKLTKIPFPKFNEATKIDANFDIIKNSIKIWGSNNNINQIVIKEGEKTSIILFNSLFKIVKSLNDIVDSGNIFQADDKRLQTILELAKKYKKYLIIKLSILTIGSIILIISIKGGLIAKAGLTIIPLMGYFIIITPLSNNENIQLQKSSNTQKVIINNDSTFTTSNPLPRESQYDFAKLPVSEEHDWLIGMTEAVAFFQKEDSINHSSQNYYVKQRDDRAYLQIANYKDIKQAAIQRRNLIENHGFNETDCKIIYNYKFGDNRYAVTIINTARDNIERIADIQTQWNKRAKTSNVKAYLITN